MSLGLLATTAIVITGLAHAFQIASSVVTARRVRRARSSVGSSHSLLAPVAIVVPIGHVDAHLPDAVETLFLLEGQRAQLVFCLPQASAAEAIVTEVANRHSRVPYRILVGRSGFSVNPKLDNLGKAFAEAEAEWCCIIDANVLVPPDYLTQLAAAVDNDVAVVSALPLGINIEGFWSEVEAAFLNTYQARLQLTADTIGAGFAHGKTMLFRTADLRRWGGISALSSDVAEDAAITKLAWRDGRRVKLLDTPVPQPLGRRVFSEVWRRQIRWAQLRRQSFPRLFLAEPLSTSLLPALAAGVAANLLDIGFLVGVLASLTLWVTVETLLGALAGWRWGLGYALACAVRDALALAIWMMAWGRHTYDWRGNSVDMRNLRTPGS